MCMAERIKNRRLLMGFTQEELANRLGLQKSAIAKYENGRVENIKRSIIGKMADVLDCSPSYLMGWDDSHDSSSMLLTDKTEKAIVTEYRRADDITQAMVLRALDIDKITDDSRTDAKMA